MRFSRWFVAILLLIGVLFQGPVFSSHALTHALDRIHDHSAHSPGPHLSAPDCDLCDAYRIQSTVIAVAPFRDFVVLESSSFIVAHRSETTPRKAVAFRSRAPPEV